MTFTHPLARTAKVWPAQAANGQSRGVLVIVTTLELDPEGKRFKADRVDRLSDAAKEWCSFNQDKADEFMLVARAKDW